MRANTPQQTRAPFVCPFLAHLHHPKIRVISLAKATKTKQKAEYNPQRSPRSISSSNLLHPRPLSRRMTLTPTRAPPPSPVVVPSAPTLIAQSPTLTRCLIRHPRTCSPHPSFLAHQRPEHASARALER